MKDDFITPYRIRIELDGFLAEKNDNGHYIINELGGTKHIVEMKSIEYAVVINEGDNVIESICNALLTFKNTKGIKHVSVI